MLEIKVFLTFFIYLPTILFVSVVSLVSVVSFRSFRFVVSGFSTCPAVKAMTTSLHDKSDLGKPWTIITCNFYCIFNGFELALICILFYTSYYFFLKHLSGPES